jgi:hypothetical protein
MEVYINEEIGGFLCYYRFVKFNYIRRESLLRR